MEEREGEKSRTIWWTVSAIVASFTSDTARGTGHTYKRNEAKIRGSDDQITCARSKREDGLGGASLSYVVEQSIGREEAGLRNESTDRDFNVEHTRFESIGPLLPHSLLASRVGSGEKSEKEGVQQC